MSLLIDLIPQVFVWSKIDSHLLRSEYIQFHSSHVANTVIQATGSQG